MSFPYWSNAVISTSASAAEAREIFALLAESATLVRIDLFVTVTGITAIALPVEFLTITFTLPVLTGYTIPVSLTASVLLSDDVNVYVSAPGTYNVSVSLPVVFVYLMKSCFVDESTGIDTPEAEYV